MSFSDKLQQIRQNNRISQEELAELLNVSRQSVSKWERGKGYPEIDKLVFMSYYFNISLDELLKDDAPQEQGRKPISLRKEPEAQSFSQGVREIMPQRVQEIYPSAPQPEATFKSKFDNSIAKLFVQPNQPQNIQAVNPNRRKPAVKKRKKKDSKIIFVMCALLIFSATILGTTFSIVNNVSHTVYEDNETYNAVTVEMKENNDLTNKNFLIDPVENIRYICDDWYFDMLVDASYGFVELHDVNSDEIRYFSRQNITDEGEEIYTTEDGQRYRIYPFAENLFLSDISASDYHNYVILKSESTGDSFFIDKQYIQPFEKAEAATAPISTVANDTKKLSNEEEQINE